MGPLFRTAGLVVLGALVAAAGGAKAQEALSGADIATIVVRALAEQGYAANPEISADRRFYACEGEPAVKPMFGSWDTVRVSCAAPKAWQVAIRTNRGAAVATQQQDPSAAVFTAVFFRTSLSADAVILASDVELREIKATDRNHHFSALEDVIGRRVSQNVGAGNPVLARHLHQRWAIEENMPVAIEMSVGGLLVVTAGEALENGQLGDLIKVKNTSSGRIVSGEVTGEKKVSVRANTN